MTDPIKPVQPVRKVYAQAKKPIGRVCLPCGGRGWSQAKDEEGRPGGPKVACAGCLGKGRVQ